MRHHLESLTPAYFEAFDEPDVARHLGLIIELGDDRPVVVRARPAGAGRVVGGGRRLRRLPVPLDPLHPAGRAGLLDPGGAGVHLAAAARPGAPGPAAIGPPGSGTRAARRRPGGPTVGAKIVDAFRVRQVTGPGDEPATPPTGTRSRTSWRRLARLLREDRHDEVHHRLIGRFVAALGRLPARALGARADRPDDRPGGVGVRHRGPDRGPRQLRVPLADGPRAGALRHHDRPGRHPHRRRPDRRHVLGDRPLRAEDRRRSRRSASCGSR